MTGNLDSDTVADERTDGATDDSEFEQLLHRTDLHLPESDEPIPLDELLADVIQGHEELDSYKNGSLTMCNALEARIEDERAVGNDDLVELLDNLHRACFGLYLRITRGDREIHGQRDGEYSDFLDETDPEIGFTE